MGLASTPLSLEAQAHANTEQSPKFLSFDPRSGMFMFLGSSKSALLCCFAKPLVQISNDLISGCQLCFSWLT